MQMFHFDYGAIQVLNSPQQINKMYTLICNSFFFLGFRLCAYIVIQQKMMYLLENRIVKTWSRVMKYYCLIKSSQRRDASARTTLERCMKNWQITSSNTKSSLPDEFVLNCIFRAHTHTHALWMICCNAHACAQSRSEKKINKLTWNHDCKCETKSESELNTRAYVLCAATAVASTVTMTTISPRIVWLKIKAIFDYTSIRCFFFCFSSLTTASSLLINSFCWFRLTWFQMQMQFGEEKEDNNLSVPFTW